MPPKNQLGIRSGFRSIFSRATRTEDGIPEYYREKLDPTALALLSGQNTAFRSAVDKLLRKSDELYRMDRKGKYVPMSAEDFREIVALYSDAVKAADEFIKAAGETDPASPIMQSRAVLAEDLAVLNTANPFSAPSLPDAVETARAAIITVGANIKTVGGRQSSRIPVEYVNSAGQRVRGFFTASRDFDPKKELFDTLDEVAKEFPEFQEYAEDLKTTDGYIAYFAEPEPALRFSAMWQKTSPGFLSPEYEEFEQSHPKLCQALRRKLDKMQDRVTFPFGVKMEFNTSIDQRNSVMSELADLLGVSHLIAKSTKAIIRKPDGTLLTGTFMENADMNTGPEITSVDINQITFDQAQALLPVNQDTFMAGTDALESIAGIQILDYISGNIDRHGGNLIYQFDMSDRINPRFVGVKGIDNDSCFGNDTRNKDNEGRTRLAALDDIGVIPESMANSLLKLNKAMFRVRMQNYKLTGKEIDAAWTRLKKIRERIIEGKKYYAKHPEKGLKKGVIRSVKPEEWKDYSLESLSCPVGGTTVPANAVELGHTSLFRVVRHISKSPFRQTGAHSIRFARGQKEPPTPEQLFRTAQNAELSFRRGTRSNPSYQKMLELLDSYRGLVTDPAHPPKPGEETYAAYRLLIEKLTRVSRDYLDYKKNSPDTTSRTARARIAAAEMVHQTMDNVYTEICHREMEETQREVARMKFYAGIIEHVGQRADRIAGEERTLTEQGQTDRAGLAAAAQKALLRLKDAAVNETAELNSEEIRQDLAALTAYRKMQLQPDAAPLKEEEIRELASGAEITSAAAMSRDDLCKFVLNNGENALCRELFGLKPAYSGTAEEQLDMLRTRKDFMMTRTGEDNIREILNSYDDARAELRKFAEGTDGKDSVAPETTAAFLRGAALLCTIQKGQKVDMEYLNAPGIAAKQLSTALASETAKQPLTQKDAALLLTPEGEQKYEHRFRKDLSDLLLEKLSPKLSSPVSMRTELEKRKQELEPVHPEVFK